MGNFWIFIVVIIAVGVVGAVIWGFVFESIWKKLPEKTQKIIQGVGIVFIIWVFIVAMGSGKSSGTGEVNLFTGELDSKNYRLNATITKVNEYQFLFYSTHYELEDVEWPNGGSSYFNDCKINSSGRTLCESGDGKEYYAELNYFESDSSDSYD